MCNWVSGLVFVLIASHLQKAENSWGSEGLSQTWQNTALGCLCLGWVRSVINLNKNKKQRLRCIHSTALPLLKSVMCLCINGLMHVSPVCEQWQVQKIQTHVLYCWWSALSCPLAPSGIHRDFTEPIQAQDGLLFCPCSEKRFSFFYILFLIR